MFVNTTNRIVNLYWVRRNEERRNVYSENIELTLKPKQEVRVNTYSSHTWFFRDYFTGERMHVRAKPLFFPIRIRLPKREQPDVLCDVRSRVSIHFPVRTLRENCLWLIVKWLSSSSDSAARELINRFQIPYTLKQQLRHLLNCILNYRCITEPII
ncbi:Vhl [Drosophila busckii]|uniref:Vhl n=2 Tax=Drosophila busckii TaxID=30019 RepID=A0A0M4EJM4_DROBS|nr:Vhl [Drosophila busckii]